jgi:fructose-1-phosphate kinase PfkB-like protein
MHIRETLKNIRKRLFAKSILVIGSAHLYTIGRYGPTVASDIDKIGYVDMSPGGTGLNIAFYANNYLNVKFVTAFRKDTILYSTILRLLGIAGISKRHIGSVESDHLGGYSAHYLNNELVSAVTKTLVEQLDIERHLRQRWLSWAACTVCDLNLAAHQVAYIEKLCRENKKKIIVAGVSEAKCTRINDVIAINKDPDFFLFSINAVEAKRLFNWDPSRLNVEYATEFCNRLHCRWIIVTLGASGYIILGKAGEVIQTQAPSGVAVVSSSGARDALLAVFVVSIAKHDGLDFPDATRRASEFVTECLSLPTPVLFRRHTKYRQVLESLQIWDTNLGRPKVFVWLVLVTSFLYSLISLVGKVSGLRESAAKLLGVGTK